MKMLMGIKLQGHTVVQELNRVPQQSLDLHVPADLLIDLPAGDFDVTLSAIFCSAKLSKPSCLVGTDYPYPLSKTVAIALHAKVDLLGLERKYQVVGTTRNLRVGIPIQPLNIEETAEWIITQLDIGSLQEDTRGRRRQWWGFLHTTYYCPYARSTCVISLD